MPKPVFRRIAPTEKRSDGYHHLLGDWTGRPMPLFEGQHVGTVVASDATSGGLAVVLQAFHENGDPLSGGVKAVIPKGKAVTYDFAFLDKHLEGLGKITLRVTPQETPEDAIEAVIETYPGMWGLFGTDVLNPLPTQDEITAIEAQTGQTLCEDHRRFLQTRNGINWRWWHQPVWNTGMVTDHKPFITALQTAESDLPEIGLLQDATGLFAAGEGHPYLGYPERLGDMGFYDTAFLRFGIPVGVDGGGNLFVQILAGARRGEIVFLDHEYHYGMLDNAEPPQLAPDVREGGPDKPLEDFTGDEFWDHMITVGYAIPAAASLDEMIATLSTYHSALIARLAPQWRAS